MLVQELIKRAAEDLVNSSYAIALTGAGISTESGVPDFRGPQGIWTTDPQAEKRAYQSYDKFLTDPKDYWEDRLAKPSLLGNLEEISPNPGHHALAGLEEMGVLKCVITQNVDNLHIKAGSRNVVEYHGNAFKLRCANCNARYGLEEYDLAKLRQEGKLPPLCRSCGAVVKMDVVHFRESIPSDVAHRSLQEAWKCDVMLVCGTSAVVYPFASLPTVAFQRKMEKEKKTQSGFHVVERVRAATIIEINAEPTPLTYEGVSDYLIQGNTAEILPLIVGEVKRLQKR